MLIKSEIKNFYKITDNTSIKNILSKSLLINNSFINKNFKIINISTIDNIKNNSLLFLDKNFVTKITKKMIYKKNIHVITNYKKINSLKLFNSFSLVDNLKLQYNNIINY